MQKVFKHPKIFVSFILLSLFLVYSCDSNDGTNEIICISQEFLQNLSDAECLSEEMILGCTVNCVGVNSEIFIRNLDGKCALIDCETLECTRIKVIQGEDTITSNGFMINIALDQAGFPIGIFQVNSEETEFTCSSILPQ